MKELLERLRGATGASRDLDAAIMVALNQRPDWLERADGHLYVSRDRTSDGPVVRWLDVRSKRTSPGNPPAGPAAPYTASLDAALALVERVLPGANWLVSHVVKSRWSKHAFWATCGSGAGKYEAYAPTAPLALLIALLGALSGRPKAEDGTVEAGPGTNNNPSLSKPNQ